MVGRTLCRVRLLREPSRGGMGVVYEAEDGRLGRKIALGLLPEHMARGAGRVLRMLESHRASAA